MCNLFLEENKKLNNLLTKELSKDYHLDDLFYGTGKLSILNKRILIDEEKIEKLGEIVEQNTKLLHNCQETMDIHKKLINKYREENIEENILHSKEKICGINRFVVEGVAVFFAVILIIAIISSSKGGI